MKIPQRIRNRLSGVKMDRLGSWLMWAPGAVCVLWFGVLVVWQGVLGVPVANRVLAGDRVQADNVYLGWAPFRAADVEVEIEVARDRAFRHVIYRQSGSDKHLRFRVSPSPVKGRYYWRIRSIRGGQRSPWTHPIPFTVYE